MRTSFKGVTPQNCLFPALAHRDQNHFCFRQFLNASDIILSLRRKVFEIAGIPQLALPSRNFFIYGYTFLQDFNRRRNFLAALIPVLVGCANFNGLKLAEHIHFGQGDSREAVQADCIPEQGNILPTTSSWPSGGCSEFSTPFPNSFPHLVFKLGGKRSFAHPSRVRLGVSHYLGV